MSGQTRLGPGIELVDVTRSFGETVAVDAARASFAPGEIHAVIGENGAGKSTLLKLAAGALPPSSGVVCVAGRALEPPTTAEAIRRGVGLVYQHFMLCGALRAIENVVLGAESVGAFGKLDERGARRKAEAILARVNLDVPLDAMTDDLTVGQRQRLEILRVLYRGASAVLLDEPTAVLSPLEASELYATLRRLADEGSTIVVVTHRLDEVVRHADRVTVMRKGRVVLERALRDAVDEATLTRAIMGGDAPAPFKPPALAPDAKTLLSIAGLRVVDASGRALLDGLDIDVRAGEIVGIAGVEGNGQRELVRALAGLEPRPSRKVVVGDRDLTLASPETRRLVLGIVHEDRQVDGLVLDATVGDNLILGELAAGFDEGAAIRRRIERFDVRPADPSRRASELSGGNQQKIVVARAIDRLTTTDAALVLAQPTRGVDVGAAAMIHAAIGAAAAKGLAVLVISADLVELKKLCHRLVVMHRGRFVGTFAPDVDESTIGRAMLGMEAA